MLVDEGIIKPLLLAQFVVEHAEYGYTTNLPLKVVLQDNFLLATHFNGDPLTPDHGYPLRGVIGASARQDDLKETCFWKGAKCFRGLEFTTQDRSGFWEQAGYHNEADIWKEERIGRGY